VHARWISLFWGTLILTLSLYAGSIAPTVIEAINKVGSALYGPILGVFLLAIFKNRTSALGVNIGLLTGMLLNLYFWLYEPQIFWMWWNFIGLLVTVVIAYAVALLKPNTKVTAQAPSSKLHISKQDILITGGILVGFFVLVVALSYSISVIGQSMIQ